MELRPGFKEKNIHELAKNLKLEVVVTGDVYFQSKYDYKSYLILCAISNNTKIDQLDLQKLKSDIIGSVMKHK